LGHSPISIVAAVEGTGVVEGVVGGRVDVAVGRMVLGIGVFEVEIGTIVVMEEVGAIELEERKVAFAVERGTGVVGGTCLPLTVDTAEDIMK